MPPLPIRRPIRRRLCLGLAGVLAAAALGGGAAGGAAPSPATAPGASGAGPRLAVAGLRIQVTDLGAAEQFYTRALGFAIVRGAGGGTGAVLRNGAVELHLRQVAKPAPAHYPGDAEIHVNFEVKSLAATIKDLAAAGVPTVEGSPQPAAIGTYVTIKDPAGNIHQLLELTKPRRPADRPTVFNLEIEVTDMKRARTFYVDRLGFEVETERFFPPTIPLRERGPAPLVLQETAQKTVPVDYPHDSRTIIQLAARDPAAAAAALAKAGVTLLPAAGGGSGGGGGGRAVALQDPFGNVFELVPEPGAAGR
jgi:catechol 2,3-dioxygenase-like lactoylglutathione lyase family enzyme